MALLSLAKNANLIGFDVDMLMMKKAKERIENCPPSEIKELRLENRISYVHGNYSDIKNVLNGEKTDFILNDLGVNLEHFKAVER